MAIGQNLFRSGFLDVTLRLRRVASPSKLWFLSADLGNRQLTMSHRSGLAGLSDSWLSNPTAEENSLICARQKYMMSCAPGLRSADWAKTTYRLWVAEVSICWAEPLALVSWLSKDDLPIVSSRSIYLVSWAARLGQLTEQRRLTDLCVAEVSIWWAELLVLLLPQAAVVRLPVPREGEVTADRLHYAVPWKKRGRLKGHVTKI